ncbi:hypothetical protein FDI11_gp26 [Mycobacterium phage Tiger]|uniref:Uncharacterized protein n=2 Tax=Benedictvirus TaxID=2946819 RepID=H9NCX8_9CAUD|nr:hypothetical protein X823_gp26 [Mycobacterium phage Conspiracy]YP_008859092.1 hypothetical protein X816_gp24 [Mycobacterium phage Jovo]YP_009607709.1 hypothetical protein FDI11_gp26 [Mycobacterium phage Tiger]ATW60039.1 hypothetical protein SEA_PHLORENCE_65 [Mycobacterium phage Phlorence]ATW60459.1 hypothetical protein SEA_FORGETIT_67 [Mycobacterium phage ForGetIt]ATW61012.1 hypothetical protein SEA_ARAGOG_66 [Mycobacterium phage Aragog]ATW61254.1 hypothetical protein SEA_AGENTM_66 [Mycoba
MTTYKKDLPLSTEAEYWFVEMGRLDRLNGPSSYPFPAEQAAFRFAAAEKRRAAEHKWLDMDDTWHHGVDRDIAVRFPDGTRVTIPLPELGDIDDYDEDEL